MIFRTYPAPCLGSSAYRIICYISAFSVICLGMVLTVGLRDIYTELAYPYLNTETYGLSLNLRIYLKYYSDRCLQFPNQSQSATGSELSRQRLASDVLPKQPIDSQPPFCSCLPPNSSNFETDWNFEMQREIPSEEQLAKAEFGGHWSPVNCVARQRVAIIVPYRNREKHLRIFLSFMHPFLQRQNISYRIFVVEQLAPDIFNRAALMNIGYLQASTTGHFDCYIFHDVDLLPMSHYTFYNCYMSPLLIGAYMDKFSFKLPYVGFCGGALALSDSHVKIMNGFSNRFYGWGGEDDDIFNRMKGAGLKLHTYPVDISKTHMIVHSPDALNPPNDRRFEMLESTNSKRDGLSTVKYKLEKLEEKELYTWVTAYLERDYEEACIVDPSKAPTDPGNYVDCYKHANFMSGTLYCCREDGIVFCCSRGYWQQAPLALLLLMLVSVAAFLCRRKYRRKNKTDLK